MSDKFRVILADLSDAASTFHSESAVLNGLLSGSATPLGVDGGDSALNATLKAVLDALIFLNGSLAGQLSGHGDKLKKVRDNYQQVDQSMHELFDDLMPDS